MRCRFSRLLRLWPRFRFRPSLVPCIGLRLSRCLGFLLGFRFRPSVSFKGLRFSLCTWSNFRCRCSLFYNLFRFCRYCRHSIFNRYCRLSLYPRVVNCLRWWSGGSRLRSVL